MYVWTDLRRRAWVWPVILAALLAAEHPARAVEPGLLPGALGVNEIFATDQASGVAIGGYDPVTFALGPRPRRGDPAHSLVWSGQVWRFVGEANRAAFGRDPAAFAPRLGGYDAERLAGGVLVAGDPSLFVLRDGRPYFFRNPDHRARFLAGPHLAAAAEAGWLTVRAGLVQD